MYVILTLLVSFLCLGFIFIIILTQLVYNCIFLRSQCCFFCHLYSHINRLALFMQAGTGIAELIALEISRQVLLHFLLDFSAVSGLCYTRPDGLTISKCADESSYRGVPQENLAC